MSDTFGWTTGLPSSVCVVVCAINGFIAQTTTQTEDGKPVGGRGRGKAGTDTKISKWRPPVINARSRKVAENTFQNAFSCTTHQKLSSALIKVDEFGVIARSEFAGHKFTTR